MLLSFFASPHMNTEYTLTFDDEELTLLIHCIQKDMLTKKREPEVEIEPGVFTRAPQHFELLDKLLDVRDETLDKASRVGSTAA